LINRQSRRESLEDPTTGVSMAILRNKNTQEQFHLSAHHSFGRLKRSVNTVIASPEISKIHAVIEWNGQYWFLRDLSSNGTWYNGKRALKDQTIKLKAGDSLSFADKNAHEFELVNANKPCDILVAVGHDSDAIELAHYHLLPNQDKPEVILSFDVHTETWWQEILDDNSDSPAMSLVVDNGDTIEFAGQAWQMHVNRVIEETQQLFPAVASIDELKFEFKTSLDEETTQLKIEAAEQPIDLLVRSHHYLTLNLARKRAEDIQAGLDEYSQGWVYADMLAKDLGLDVCHLNIQIHRIRKQFVDALSNACDSKNLIERESGKLRFGGKAFRITKGLQLEFCSDQKAAIA
jgi:hypothetical protein